MRLDLNISALERTPQFVIVVAWLEIRRSRQNKLTDVDDFSDQAQLIESQKSHTTDLIYSPVLSHNNASVDLNRNYVGPRLLMVSLYQDYWHDRSHA